MASFAIRICLIPALSLADGCINYKSMAIETRGTLTGEFRDDYYARTTGNESYTKERPVYLVRLCNMKGEDGEYHLAFPQSLSPHSPTWSVAPEVIEDIYRCMIDFDEITKEEGDVIIERWREDSVKSRP